MKYINAYLLIMNALGFLFMFIDNENSKMGLRRIPERILFTIAGIGGSLGTLLGIYLCRHKTKYKRFTIGIPSMLAVHIVITVVLHILF